MLSLGIDPGTATVGYGLVRQHADNTMEAIKYGVITTTPDQPMPRRLEIIFESIQDLIAVYKPDRAAVEELFFGKNVTTAITVAQGRGVIVLAFQVAKLPIAQYKPNLIKQTVSGYGGAKKPQMQEMVRMMLGLDEIPKPDDAADALAVAITDIQHAQYASLADYSEFSE
jgi:crossover junction endodeoxyribonuclease RuvC